MGFHDDVVIKRRTVPGNSAGKARKTNGSAKKEKKTNSGPGHSGSYKRNVRIISVLMLFLALLIFLSMISYSPKDYLNTRLSFSEFTGIFTGNDVVRARIESTQNWLGLLGALVSEFLYNSTIGIAAFLFPAFLAIWAKNLFQHLRIPERLLKITLAAFSIGLLFSSTVAAFSNISWLPDLGYYWYGAVGMLLADIFSMLLGTVGTFLLFIAACTVVVIKLTNVDTDILLQKMRNLTIAALRYIKYLIVKPAVTEESTQNGPIEEQESAESQPEGIFGKFKNIIKSGPGKTEEETVTEPDIIEEPEPAAEDFSTIKKEIEPARIIKKNLDIKVNNPFNRNNPVLGLKKSDKNIQKEHSLVDDLINEEYGGNNGTEKPPEKPAERKSEGNAADSPAEKPGIKEIENVNSEPIKPLNSAIDEKGRPAEIEENIKSDNSVPENNGNDSDDINIDDLFNGIRNKKPLMVTVNEKNYEDEEEEEIEPYNPLGTYIHDEEINYRFPTTDFLEREESMARINDDELKMNARILQEKLETFKIEIENLTVTPGPVVTQYEFVPAPGIKISRIESLADDIAMALKAKGIRIIAPIPGKGTVGIEIPNSKMTTVRFRSIINSQSFREGNYILPMAFGKTISGDVFCSDLAKMPHLLIAGSTGAGKSVGINTIIGSLLYKMHPKNLKFVIIDPKKVELAQYKKLENHFLAKSPDINDLIITDPESAVIVLKALCAEMDRRYDILAKVGQRNIIDYNKKVRDGNLKDDEEMVHREMPYIVCVIDELADLMLTASKEVETPLIRLAQLARAIGIHLVVATQRPSVNVITGIIKANFPARIAYLVASKVDSRTILDTGGADQLLGQGDMLFLPNGSPKPIRLQNAFISTDEVENICKFIGDQKGYSQPYMLPSLIENDDNGSDYSKEDRDPLFEDAARLIISHQQGSVSLIQRRLKVGYARAGRIIDELEAAGVVGPYDGSKARRVYMESESDLEAVL